MPPVVRRALAAAAAAAAAALPTGAVAQPAELGHQLYAEHCAECHGSQGDGQGDRGPSLAGAGALAADFYLRTGYMPLGRPGEQPTRNEPSFDDQELEALIAYVASLGTGPAVPSPHPERGSVAEGRRLFASSCAGCHQIVGEGGYLTGARVPSLDRATPVQIAEAVRLGPYLMPQFDSRHLTGAQLDSLIAYVEYAQSPDDRGGWALGHLGPIPEGLVTWLIGAAVLVATCMAIGKRLRSTPG
jgi:ubiquinol-cytochrome c reductase cytochrome c subunit